MPADGQKYNFKIYFWGLVKFHTDGVRRSPQVHERALHADRVRFLDRR